MKKYHIDKSIPIPLYFQLKEILLKEIKSTYSAGDTFPTEMEICELFGLSRPTVRQAINELVNEGYLYRQRGRGTFVSKPKIAQDFANVIESFNNEMSKKNIIPKTKVLELIEMECPAEISEKLNLIAGEEVAKLTRLRYANDEPLLVVTTYTPLKIFPEILKCDFEESSLYDYFKQNGHDILKVSRTFEARISTKAEEKILGLNEKNAIHYFETIATSTKGDVIEYSVCSYRGDMNKFRVEIYK